MKKILFLLCLALLLTGCSLQPAETVPPTAASTEAPTEPPTEAPTEAPTEPPPTAAEVLLSQMTTEEKVGQLFLARCNEATALTDIETCHLGGLLLFGVDIDGEDPVSLTAKLQAYQQASAIPLLIAVDEEGGTVCRVSSHQAFRQERFPSPRDAFAAGGMAGALQTQKEICQLLSGLGINVNLGPVCDITTSRDAFMYKRSLGQDPETTGSFIAQSVEIMSQHRIGSALKHFPGYGESDDTHIGSALDMRSLEALEQVDLVPFRYGIGAGCGAVMVSHTVVTALDGELPASLSPAVHTYLRDTMAFTGVILTDDLSMQAITDTYGTAEAAVLAVLAGNDLLCSSAFEIQYEAVLAAVEEGRISQATLDAAVLRVLNWKQNLGLIG